MENRKEVSTKLGSRFRVQGSRLTGSIEFEIGIGIDIMMIDEI
jgi:hypothetical protein